MNKTILQASIENAAKEFKLYLDLQFVPKLFELHGMRDFWNIYYEMMIQEKDEIEIKQKQYKILAAYQLALFDQLAMKDYPILLMAVMFADVCYGAYGRPTNSSLSISETSLKQMRLMNTILKRQSIFHFVPHELGRITRILNKSSPCNEFAKSRDKLVQILRDADHMLVYATDVNEQVKWFNRGLAISRQDVFDDKSVMYTSELKNYVEYLNKYAIADVWNTRHGKYLAMTNNRVGKMKEIISLFKTTREIN